MSLLHIRFFVYISFSSVLIIYHFNIHLSEAGVMHEAEYVYSICITKYHFTLAYFTSVHFIIWAVLLANARLLLTSSGTCPFIMHAYMYSIL